MLSIQFLRLYKYLDTWCFDFPALGIEREPFVEGMPEMIDAVLAEKPSRIEKPVLVFSTKFNPGCRLRLDWIKSEERSDGQWNCYECTQLGRSGWLCPCLLQFFDTAPGTVYFDLYAAEKVSAEFTRLLEASAP